MRDGMESSDMYFFENPNLSSFIFKRFGKIRDLGFVRMLEELSSLRTSTLVAFQLSYSTLKRLGVSPPRIFWRIK